MEIVRKYNLRIFLGLAIPWALLWYVPWTVWFNNIPWLRLGIAGIIFIAPGMTVSMYLLGDRLTLLSHFTSGLALSIFLIGSFGVMGKVIHLSFKFIESAVFVVGLVAFFILAIHTHRERRLYRPEDFSTISTLLLLFMIIFGAMISYISRFGGDEFTYLAYLTNWQHSSRLDIIEVMFGSGTLEPIRFWLAMFPMAQAFLAEISNLHGVLLLGYYLKPVLVAVSLLAIYNFYEDLLRSNFQAIIALLLQYTFLFLLFGQGQPGEMFFFRIGEDKSFAAFALAPVFFLAISCFLESPILRRGVFVLLSGWCLALVHPIILTYSIFIAGLYVAIITITHKDYKSLGVLIILFMLIIGPSASLRFISPFGVGTQAPFDLESALTISPDRNPIGGRISYIEGTPFYGFNLDWIKIQFPQRMASPWSTLLSWSYLWLLGLGFLWSLAKLKRQNNMMAPFIVASSLLVLLCAIPYTGWLVGYFVSARMLWRSPWLFPIGLVGINLITDSINIVLSKVTIVSRHISYIRKATFVGCIAIWIIVTGYYYIYLYPINWYTRENLQEYKMMLEERASIGDYIETNVEQPSIFLASLDMMAYLPGLSSKAKVVFFRSAKQTPNPIKRATIEHYLSSDRAFSIEERMEFLRTYHVQYLLTQDPYTQEYYASYPQFFNWEKLGDFWLIKYSGTAEDQ
jgi:hypothetical protein